VRKLLEIAEQIGIPIVISSALDSAVGIATGLHAAAALPHLEHACGLGTGALLMDDVVEPMVPVDGHLPVTRLVPERARLEALAAPPDRRRWWIDRVTACYQLMA
jgi:o-succinylbenzoate synthase